MTHTRQEYSKMGLILDLFTTGYNMYNNYQNRKQSQDQFQQSFNWNQDVQNESWRREDNQLQRATADAQAAGFSPLAALGQTATGTTVSAPSATTPNTSPLQSIDTSSLLNYDLENRRLAQEKEMFDSDMQYKYDQLGQGDEHFSRELEQRKQEASDALIMASQSNRKDLSIAANSLSEIIRHNRATESETSRANKAQEVLKQEEQYFNWYKEHHESGSPMPVICKSEQEYESALGEWLNRFDAFVNTNGLQITEDVTNELGLSAELGASASLGAKSGGKKSSGSAGLGASAAVSGSKGGSKHTSDMTYQQAMINQYIRTHPLPMSPSFYKRYKNN